MANSKIDISKQFDLPVLNQAINGNFNNLELHFICGLAGRSYPTIFTFREIKFLDDKKVVIGGTFSELDKKTSNGTVEYRFKKGKFCRKNYRACSVIRLHEMRLDIWIPENKSTADSFIDFLLKYLEKVETTCESLQGKKERPNIIYGLSDRGKEAVKRGKTADMVFRELEEKYGILL